MARPQGAENSHRSKAGDEFSGEIVVASKIVDYLSSGLYESPAACLKELVNNSYDADATEVKVFVQPDADRIIIADDGHGMNRRDFERDFSRISESFKRSKSSYTDQGRPKIGKIGIGFIAANEICDKMEIHSTKAGSTELLKVTIDFETMREDIHKRKRSETDYAKGDYYGQVLSTDRASHYTIIFLRSVRGGARQILVGAASPTGHDGQRYSLYGKTADQIAQDLRSLTLSAWSDFDPYTETMLQVALNVPVKYHDNWIPGRIKRSVQEFETAVANLGFSVFYDGTDLRKPIVFRDEAGDAILRRFEFQGKRVSAEGYFYVHHGSIKPQDLNGLLIRIRNAAIGGYDPGFMNFPSSIGPLFQRWISAEIWASDELEDAMNIDRKTLRVAHPAYVELQKAVHDKLSEVISTAREKIYKTGSQKRKFRKTEQTTDHLLDVIDRQRPIIGARLARSLEEVWRSSKEDDPKFDKKILQKFSVAELYDLVITAATEVLTPTDLSRFLTALTKRLTK